MRFHVSSILKDIIMMSANNNTLAKKIFVYSDSHPCMINKFFIIIIISLWGYLPVVE